MRYAGGMVPISAQAREFALWRWTAGRLWLLEDPSVRLQFLDSPFMSLFSVLPDLATASGLEVRTLGFYSAFPWTPVKLLRVSVIRSSVLEDGKWRRDSCLIVSCLICTMLTSQYRLRIT